MKIFQTPILASSIRFSLIVLAMAAANDTQAKEGMWIPTLLNAVIKNTVSSPHLPYEFFNIAKADIVLTSVDW